MSRLFWDDFVSSKKEAVKFLSLVMCFVILLGIGLVGASPKIDYNVIISGKNIEINANKFSGRENIFNPTYTMAYLIDGSRKNVCIGRKDTKELRFNGNEFTNLHKACLLNMNESNTNGVSLIGHSNMNLIRTDINIYMLVNKEITINNFKFILPSRNDSIISGTNFTYHNDFLDMLFITNNIPTATPEEQPNQLVSNKNDNNNFIVPYVSYGSRFLSNMFNTETLNASQQNNRSPDFFEGIFNDNSGDNNVTSSRLSVSSVPNKTLLYMNIDEVPVILPVDIENNTTINNTNRYRSPDELLSYVLTYFSKLVQKKNVLIQKNVSYKFCMPDFGINGVGMINGNNYYVKLFNSNMNVFLNFNSSQNTLSASFSSNLNYYGDFFLNILEHRKSYFLKITYTPSQHIPRPLAFLDHHNIFPNFNEVQAYEFVDNYFSIIAEKFTANYNKFYVFLEASLFELSSLFINSSNTNVIVDTRLIEFKRNILKGLKEESMYSYSADKLNMFKVISSGGIISNLILGTSITEKLEITSNSFLNAEKVYLLDNSGKVEINSSITEINNNYVLGTNKSAIINNRISGKIYMRGQNINFTNNVIRRDITYYTEYNDANKNINLHLTSIANKGEIYILPDNNFNFTISFDNKYFLQPYKPNNYNLSISDILMVTSLKERRNNDDLHIINKPVLDMSSVVCNFQYGIRSVVTPFYDDNLSLQDNYANSVINIKNSVLRFKEFTSFEGNEINILDGETTVNIVLSYKNGSIYGGQIVGKGKNSRLYIGDNSLLIFNIFLDQSILDALFLTDGFEEIRHNLIENFGEIINSDYISYEISNKDSLLDVSYEEDDHNFGLVIRKVKKKEDKLIFSFTVDEATDMIIGVTKEENEEE